LGHLAFHNQPFTLQHRYFKIVDDMKYTVSGNVVAHKQATFTSKQTNVSFGIKSDQDHLPNPTESLLETFAAC
jgi:hypothetical protein